MLKLYYEEFYYCRLHRAVSFLFSGHNVPGETSEEAADSLPAEGERHLLCVAAVCVHRCVCVSEGNAGNVLQF